MTKPMWDGRSRGYVPQEPLTISEDLPLYQHNTTVVDPVTFEVVRYSLLNINVEHGHTIQRLCVSPVTMLARDFQPSLMTATGDLVFLGPYLQYFSNAQSLTIKWICENRSSAPGIRPGDMFLSNDPYVGSPHQPDTIIAAPVFVGDELFAWVANVLHHTDIGGTAPGSFCVDAKDMFDDPPAFPPYKLVEGGEVRPDLEEIFLRQSRSPGNVQMDLRAAISAARVAVHDMEELIDRYGADVVKTVMDRVVDSGEKVLTDRLAQIPDGSWTHRVYAEAAHTGDGETYAYQLTLRKSGGDLYVDNAGTDPQAGSINVTYAGMCGAFLSALCAALTSDLAGAYGGVYRRVHFDLTPGTLSCADHPAAVSPSGTFTMELLIGLAGSVISKMLAFGRPEIQRLAIGPAHPAFYGAITAGANRAGEPFIGVNANNMIGALSASPIGDGVDFGGHFWIPEGIASNVEELEQLWPTLFLYRKAMTAGADGAGRYRGGRSLIEGAIPWKVPGLAAALYIDESFPKTTGLFGANPGSAGRFRVRHRSDVLTQLASGVVPTSVDDVAGVDHPVEAKGPMILLGADTVYEWSASNGVGYGDPLQRDPALVAVDVAAGYLGTEAAERVYGVVIDGAGTPDAAATERCRREMLGGRLSAATTPPAVGTVGVTVQIEPVGGELGVVRDVRGVPVSYASLTGRADLGPVSGNYRDHCASVESSMYSVDPAFGHDEARAGASVSMREYLCPVTGYRLDVEILREGDEPIWDIAIVNEWGAE
ncbi:hydantoinase B/oxoprolinase family protein [Gordonia sp. VNK21]|uniref:hydantoinase B/oxoprolinase family protein n=1 Tax=Gordonia sp. VNK21 TaxID=3382483 RepID=UPI0038D3D939